MSLGWMLSVLLCVATALCLAGCEDRSSDTPTADPVNPTPAPDDNEPPIITSGLSSRVDYPDHLTGRVSDYDATDPDGDDITWSLEGNDRHAFSIDASGVLTFRSSPNSNNPMDSDQDNVYNLVVVATDDGTPSKSAKREVRIAVYKLYGHPVYPCGPLGMYGVGLLVDSLGPFANDPKGVREWLDEPLFLHWVPGDSLLVFGFEQDIWAVSTDGVELRRIVDPNPSSPSGSRGYRSMYGFGADVSPDGSRIAYSSCEFPVGDLPSRYILYDPYILLDTGYEIGVIDLDGAGQVRLTKNGDFDSLPVWSPDGTQIAYVGHGSMFFTAHDSDLFTMSADGSRRQSVFSTLSWPPFPGVAYYPPAWSPDGQSLAVVARKGFEYWTTILYTVGADGSDPREFGDTRGIQNTPSWSPDGEHLAFAILDVEEAAIDIAPSGIYVMRADGTDLRQIADGLVGAPAWSADGSEILFVSGGVNVVGADGSDLRELGPGARTVAPHLAVWSPDGSRIAVLGDTGGDDRQVVLLTMNSDGTDQHILVREEGGSLRARRPPPPSSSVDLNACSAGSVVPEPEANPGLVRDCETLLGVRDTLAGIAEIGWSEDIPIGAWEGVGVGGPPLRVRHLKLENRGLTGTIPSEIGRLTELTSLNLGNLGGGPFNSLTGPIPPELGELKKLEVLWLDSNYLSGNIPPEFGGLESLQTVFLDGNQLTGPIPPELGNIPLLYKLHLGHNKLSGPIPPELGKPPALSELYLNYNQLEGPIPAELGSLTGLDKLYLDNNQLEGPIPAELAGIRSLDKLSLGGNDFSGCVPVELTEIWVEESGLERCEPKEAKSPWEAMLPNCGGCWRWERCCCWLLLTSMAEERAQRPSVGEAMGELLSQLRP